MRITRCVLLFAFIPLAVQAQAPDIVTFTYSLSEGEARVTLNGFPVLDSSAATQSSGGAPVNLHLIPTDNRLEIEFTPASDTGAFRLALRGSAGGEMIGTDEAGDVASVALSGADGPQAVTETFDLPGPWQARFTAGHLYDEAPAITDRTALKDYALNLLDLLAQGDYEVLAAESFPMLQAQRTVTPSAGLPTDDADLIALYAGALRRSFAGMAIDSEVSAAELSPRPWADGRLWELGRINGRPLVAATDGQGGAFSWSPFVAHVDGALKIVR